MSRYAIAALGAVLLLCGGVAYGQKKDPKRIEAERLFRAGEAAYEAAQYQAAARAFEDSFAILPLPQIAFSAAQAHRLQYFVDKETWRLMRAIELYRLYISKLTTGGRRDVAVAHLAELEPLLARIQGAMGTGETPAAPAEERTQIMITSPIEDAVVDVKGKTEKLPVVVDVEPGRHEVRVRAAGYVETRRRITALAGRMVTTEISLMPEPATVRVTGESDASVTVDGRPMGETPMIEPVKLDAGTYHLVVSKVGHRPYSKEISLDRGDSLDLKVSLRMTRRRKVALVTLGTATVMAAATLAVWLSGQPYYGEADEILDKRSQVELTEQEINDYNNAREEYNDARTLTYSFVAATLVTAAAGGVLYFLDNPQPPPRPSPAPRSEEPEPAPAKPMFSIMPHVGPSTAGAVVSGSF